MSDFASISLLKKIQNVDAGNTVNDYRPRLLFRYN